MAKAKSYLPERHHSVTPHLLVSNAVEAIAFYKKAFGAALEAQVPGPTPGSTLHAEIRIGDSAVFLMDLPGPAAVKSPTAAGTTTAVIHLFVPNVDAVVNQAVAAGAKVLMPVADMMWGDRYGQIQDPFGHVWALATHQEDVSPAELEVRTKAFFEQMGGAR